MWAESGQENRNQYRGRADPALVENILKIRRKEAKIVENYWTKVAGWIVRGIERVGGG